MVAKKKTGDMITGKEIAEINNSLSKADFDIKSLTRTETGFNLTRCAIKLMHTFRD